MQGREKSSGRSGGVRGLFAALVVLALARSAQAQEEGQPIQAVRISGQQWSALDTAQTRAGLDAYQYSLGVVPLPDSRAEVREPIASDQLRDADVLLVEAPEDAIFALREGRPLRDVLAEVLGGEGAVIGAAAPADEEEVKPTQHQIALVLPEGVLQRAFAAGKDVSADSLLALGARLVLDVRPEAPCADKCEPVNRPAQLTPRPISDPGALPPPALVEASRPPDSGPAPLIRVGGPRLTQDTDDSGALRFHAETGGSGDIYRWILTSSTGQSWFLGDTVQTRSVDFSLPRADLEASYSVQAFVYAWDDMAGRYAAMKQTMVPGGYVPPPPPPPPKHYEVGVIPDAAGCPNNVPLVTINMDDEDKRNANSRWGWNGGFSSTNNTTLRFCKVDGTKFKPLSTSNSVNNHYAVLKLGNICPNGSEDVARFFDNEDNNNANSASGPLYSNVSDRNTLLRFCLFRSGTSAMSDFPSVGFSYGVFAAWNFSKALQTGYIHTDDEDTRNTNYYSGGPVGDFNRIINDGPNTNLNLARVKW